MELSSKKQHYWYRTGAHQEKYQALNMKIPMEGLADTLYVELIRCASNLINEYCTNDNHVARMRTYPEENIDDIDDLSNYIEGPECIIVHPQYQEFLDFINNTLADQKVNKIIKKIEKIIINPLPKSRNDLHQYDLLIDHIIHYIDTHPDIEFM